MSITLKARIARDNVRAESVMTGKPAWADFGANWYSVTLKRGRRTLTVPFGMGEALTGDPTAEDVLGCLLSDASSADQPFENWADDYGYDTDSRKAKQTYRQVQAQTAKLRRFLGDDFDAYVYETEQA
jgi:hypothetical protein